MQQRCESTCCRDDGRFRPLEKQVRDLEPNRSAGMPKPHRRPKVMVVDDSRASREVLARILLQRGFDVVEAQGGVQALGLIEEQHFDIMLLDIMMPDLSGIDVLRRVRESRSEIDLPIIMISAGKAAEDVVRSLDLGANDYIAKPVDLAIMLARIQTQLVRKQGADQFRQERKRIVDFAASLREQCEALLQSVQNLSQEPDCGTGPEGVPSRAGPNDTHDRNGGRDATQSRRTFKTAKIVLNGRKSVIDCVIRELSDGGALLQIQSEAGVPDEFELLWAHKPPVDCHVVQRSLNELLVRFLQ